MISNFNDFLNESSTGSVIFSISNGSYKEKGVSKDVFLNYVKNMYSHLGSKTLIIVEFVEACLDYIIKYAKVPINISAVYSKWMSLDSYSWKLYIDADANSWDDDFITFNSESFILRDSVKGKELEYLRFNRYTFNDIEYYRRFAKASLNAKLDTPVRIVSNSLGATHKEMIKSADAEFLRNYKEGKKCEFFELNRRYSSEGILWKDLPKVKKDMIAKLKSSAFPLVLQGKGKADLAKRESSAALKVLQSDPSFDNFIAYLNSSRPVSKPIVNLNKGHSYGAKSDSNTNLEYFDISKVLSTTSITKEWIWQHEKDILGKVKGAKTSIITSRSPIRISDVTNKHLVILTLLMHSYD